MLLQFTVENAWSFRERTILSMVATPGVTHSARHVATQPGQPDVLRVTALYGANASGKSNLVKAMKWAWTLVGKGVRPGEQLPIPAFRLTPNPSPVSSFEFELLLDGVRWSYGLAARPTQVEAEWLFRQLPGKNEELVFERGAPVGGQSLITLGKGLRLKQRRRAFLEFVKEGTRIEQPFVSECIERSVTELQPFTAWFKESGALFMGAGIPVPGRERFMAENASLLGFVSDMLSKSGTGVEEVAIKLSVDDVDTTLLDAVTHDQSPNAWRALVQAVADREAIHLAFRPRRGVDLSLGLDEQSDGTIRLMDLAQVLFVAIHSETTTLIIVDELERSLHPLVTRFFLSRFLETTSNRAVQLLFTTHDTNLLDLADLPRDAIWFAEKDREGSTHLFSLAEFKGEQLDQLAGDVERGYLRGRFGAIPFAGDPARLGWLDRPGP